jgi:hypothetical protein
MKSNKQRRAEIKAARLKKAQKLSGNLDTRNGPVPPHALLADHELLKHNESYYLWPLYYVDKPFICKDCKSHEVWKAHQQKWWLEIAKGIIGSTAVRCRACRNKIKDEKLQQKRHMATMAAIAPHPNDAFFKKTY